MKRVQFPASSTGSGYAQEKRLLLRLLVCASWALGGCGPATWTGGVHAHLAWSKRGVRVIEVPPDGPAARAGLLANDQLLRIDGESVAGLSAEQVQRLLAGEVGSTAKVEVLRDGVRQTLAIERVPYVAKGVSK